MYFSKSKLTTYITSRCSKVLMLKSSGINSEHFGIATLLELTEESLRVSCDKVL